MESNNATLQEKLLALQESDFLLDDMKLYLDTHPCDQRMLMKYQMQAQKSTMLRNEIEYRYNYPINSMHVQYGKGFNWINSPWPWNKDFPKAMPGYPDCSCYNNSDDCSCNCNCNCNCEMEDCD